MKRIMLCLTAVTLIFALCALPALAAVALPKSITVAVTDMPEYGVKKSAIVKGTVRLGDGKALPLGYYMKVYIKVDGAWWIKPYYDQPTTKIAAGTGAFSVAINTGGIDYLANMLRFEIYTPQGKRYGTAYIARPSGKPKSIYKTTISR